MPSIDDGINLFNLESENFKVIEEQKVENERRLNQIKTETQDVDTFLINEFSFSGMRNLYGPDKIIPDFKHCKEKRE